MKKAQISKKSELYKPQLEVFGSSLYNCYLMHVKSIVDSRDEIGLKIINLDNLFPTGKAKITHL